MANQQHLAILQHGVENWNDWRKKNPDIKPELSEANLSMANLSGVDLSMANLSRADLSGADLTGAYLAGAIFREAFLTKAYLNGAFLTEANLYGTDISGAVLTEAFLTEANLTEANLMEAVLNEAFLAGAILIGAVITGAVLSGAYLARANLTKANLTGAVLTDAFLTEADFTGAILTGAVLSSVQALETNFTAANLTGACIENWCTNITTKLTGVVCKYIYLRQDRKERRPHSGNFVPGEFTKIFQKSLEAFDLVFPDLINWSAFAYSLEKFASENQDIQLDVQSIEKTKDGVLIIKINALRDGDQEKIYDEFMRIYERVNRALEEQYKDRIENGETDETRIEHKDEMINRLFSIINHLNRKLAETSGKFPVHDQPDFQFAVGIVELEQ